MICVTLGKEVLVPLYEFRCENTHRYEISLPIQTAARRATCPECGAASTRMISSPRLGRLNSERAALIERTESSAHAPEVVDRVPDGPAARCAPVTTDPRHARLPRP